MLHATQEDEKPKWLLPVSHEGKAVYALNVATEFFIFCIIGDSKHPLWVSVSDSILSRGEYILNVQFLSISFLLFQSVHQVLLGFPQVSCCPSVSAGFPHFSQFSAEMFVGTPDNSFSATEKGFRAQWLLA